MVVRSGCGKRRVLITLLGATALLCFWWNSTPLESTQASFRPTSSKYGSREKFAIFGFNVLVKGVDDGSSRSKDKLDGHVPEISGPAKDTQPIHSNEKACKIPKLEMNGSEVAHFFKPTPKFTCKRKTENWAYIDEKSGTFALIKEREQAVCKVSGIERLNDDKILLGKFQRIQVGEKLPTDFVQVKCSNVGQNWSGLLMSVVGKDAVKTKGTETPRPSDWSGLDVYFLGMDSLSQMTYRRKLPKTVAYLENVMEAVVLDGYNIVGDGTPQAFIPILTAATEEELPLTRKRFKNASYVDDAYPFIWKNFSDAGYATLYAEDASEIGTFTYRLKGFRQQPTDHFTRTFFTHQEKVSFGKCLGSESLHKSWFRYSKEFMREYYGIPRFSLSHLSMYSHDDINMIGGIDDDFAAHLKEMHEAGHFDNALVILMADHGHRFSQLRNTHQGQLEERLPFFSFALPKKFREAKGKSAWANLQRNKDVLVTPFDIHATLMDVLHWPTDEKLAQVQDAATTRSLSLFRPIPISRTCKQADVANHWCTCLDWKDALAGNESEKKLAYNLGKTVVAAINAQTAPERTLCSSLSLKELEYAKIMVPNDGLLKYKNVKDADGFVPDLSGSTKADLIYYQLKLKTTPGRAIYEVTLEYVVSTNTVKVDLTAISHSNRYGDDPHCIISKNYFLASYCVCYDRIGAKD